MRRTICAFLLAATLPTIAVAEEGGSADGSRTESETPQQKRARLEAERDTARMKFLNFSLPQYSLEAEAKQQQIDELDAEMAKSEKSAEK